MSYSSPYSPQQLMKPQRPKFVSLVAGFAISSVIGMILGQISSFLYSLVGQGGGLECLTFPISLLIFGGTAALSFLFTRLINKKLRTR
jgi:hypothetical protein